MQLPVKLPSTIGLLALLLASSGVATASNAHQSLASISDAVEHFALDAHDNDTSVSVRVSRLDSRLRLSRCEDDLELFWAPGSKAVGNTTVAVRCLGARPWKLFVPARVSKLAEVVVATRTLLRGQRIRSDDLTVERRDLAIIGADTIADPATVAGYVLKRNVGAGRALDARMLSAPLLVERGQVVRVVRQSPGLNIHMSGIALDDGAHGERVRIRNPASNRILHAQVVTAGVVHLGGSRVTSH